MKPFHRRPLLLLSLLLSLLFLSWFYWPFRRNTVTPLPPFRRVTTAPEG